MSRIRKPPTVRKNLTLPKATWELYAPYMFDPSTGRNSYGLFSEIVNNLLLEFFPKLEASDLTPYDQAERNLLAVDTTTPTPTTKETPHA
ncbi:MAG: hypothetical protein GY721_01465 [Deltaproteobacteria bacterium]|nr:hypothetical protein [Deltaproteobacteria bacterium]